MAKLTLNDVSSGFISNTAHNTNNTLIETALENTLSRDGTGPNQMEANLDMNSFKVVNLAEPTNDNEAARLVDVQNAISGSKTANLTSFTPYSNIASNNVQAAIQEEIDDLASSSGAGLVGFLQTGTGTVVRTMHDKALDSVSVFDFMTPIQKADVRAHTGSIDVTTELQTAIDYAAINHLCLLFPSGRYKVTSTLTIYNGTQLAGETHFSYAAGYGRQPKATTISFEPSINDNLFDVTWFNEVIPPDFKFHISVVGLYIVGNANANIALNLDGVIYANIEHVIIEGFTYAIKCIGTINNRFSHCHLTGQATACVLYNGNNETTDVWEQCTFFNAPTGVAFLGSSINIRFDKCLWEQIDNYGVDIAKECQNIEVHESYCEDTPFTTTQTDAAMFRVGYIGTTLPITNHLTIIGGHYSGRNAGLHGALLNVNYCNGIIMQGTYIARYTNILRANATNCRANSITTAGIMCVSITNLYVDENANTSVAKLAGHYANSVINSGGLHQSARFDLMNTTTAEVISMNYGSGTSGNRNTTQHTSSVSTATTIATLPYTGGSASTAVITVYGSDNAGTAFLDTVVLSDLAGIVTVLSSTTILGTPPIRTYTAVAGSGTMQLAMASGTHNVNVSIQNIAFPF